MELINKLLNKFRDTRNSIIKEILIEELILIHPGADLSILDEDISNISNKDILDKIYE